MTKLRETKKDIDYLVSEVISNCYTCLYFHPEKGRAEIFSIIEDAVNLRILYDSLADSEEFKLLYEMAIEGHSHEEMAASRGISLSACKKRVQRAKQVLQRKIGK